MHLNSFAPHSTPRGKHSSRHWDFREEGGTQRGEVLAQGHKARTGRARIQAPAAEGPKLVALSHPLRIQISEQELRGSPILHKENKQGTLPAAATAACSPPGGFEDFLKG